MQKRLLALVATVAMVLSMFAGIAFAADDTYKVILNAQSVLSTGDQLVLQQVNGSVVNETTGALYSEKITVKLYKNNTFVVDEAGNETITVGELADAARAFSNGSFVVYVPTNIEAQRLVVQVEDETAAVLATATLPVKYNVTLNNPLEYVYSNDKTPVVMIGTVTDKNGKAVESAKVTLTLNDVALFTDVTTDSNGTFGQIVSFNEAGDLKLYVNDVLHQSGNVGALGMNLTVTPNNNIIHTIGATKMTFKISGGPADAVAVQIYDANDEPQLEAALTGTPVEGALELTTTWQPTAAGIYTVKATSKSHAASATVQVVSPATYNLVGAHLLESMKIGEASLTFGTDGIHLVRYTVIDGTPKVDPATFKYVVYVDGKVALDETAALENQGANPVIVKATELGSKDVRILAYEGTTKVYDETFTMAVKGWNVAIDTKELVAGEAKDVTIVIKDENDVPINNANIYIGANLVAGPTKSNIQNGTYVVKGLEYPAGSAPVTFKVQNAQGEQEVALTLNVVGKKVYTVTSDTATLLVGKEQKVRLVVAEAGKSFVPAGLMVQVGDEAAKPQAFAAVDSNKDGVYDAIDVTYTATNTKNVTFRATNHDGSLCGEVVLSVKAPKLEVIKNEFLTENFKTKVTFRVVNPIDGTVMTDNVTLDPQYVTIAVTDANGGVSGETLLGAKEHTVYVLAKDAKWDVAKDADEQVAVGLKLGTYAVDGALLVKEAALTSDPEVAIIGQANNLTLTYADANGQPIVGKKVNVVNGATSTLVGTTDESGQVAYATTGAVSFKAETAEAGKTVALNVNAVTDTVAPEVTAPATVDTATATIVIKDNVRVARLMVNGVEIDLIPRAKVKHIVKLVAGKNEFAIVAVDSNYQVTEKTVVINYVPAATGVKFVVGQAGYTSNGAQHDMVAAYKQGDHTMVAVRMLQDLGAKFAWNQATHTATFTLNGKVVKITQDSTTASVDGKVVAMPAAPRNVNGRLMVPVRFISENLGLFVHWQAGDIITIK